MNDTDVRSSRQSQREDIPTGCGPSIRTSSVPARPAKARELLAKRAGLPARRHHAEGGEPLRLVLVTEELEHDRTSSSRSLHPSTMLHSNRHRSADQVFPGAQLFAPAGEGRHPAERQVRSASSTAGTRASTPTIPRNSCAKNVPPGGYNYARYCSPEMDAAENDGADPLRPGRRARRRTQRRRSCWRATCPRSSSGGLRQMHPINVDFKGFDPSPSSRTGTRGNGASRSTQSTRRPDARTRLAAQDHRRARAHARRLRALRRRAQRLLHRQVPALLRSARTAPHRAAVRRRSSPRSTPI